MAKRSPALVAAVLAAVVGLLMVGGGPASAQEDPSGTYVGQSTTDGQPAAYTPPIDVACTGATCIVDWLGYDAEVASSGTTTLEIDTGPSACGPPLPPITLLVTLDGGSLTVESSTPTTEIRANGCIQPVFGVTTVFEGRRQASSEDAEPTGPASEGAAGAPGAAQRKPVVEVGGVEVDPELAAELSSRQVASVAAVARGDRSLVPASLATPSEAADGGSRTVVNLVLAGLAVLLLVFPSQLFNSTWSNHHRRVEVAAARFLPGQRGGGVDDLPRHRVVAYLATVVAGAVIAGFLDPAFGLDPLSMTLVLGALVSITVGSMVSGWSAVTYRRLRKLPSDTLVKAVPSGLVVAVLCVGISRAIGFRPGYLFGLVGGLAFVAAVDRAEEGRAELVAAAVGLTAALVGWFAAGPVGAWANEGDPSPAIQVADSVTAALFIGGIEGLLLGLVPLTLLPGHALLTWSRVAWGTTTFVVAFVFFQVLLRPEAGYLGTSATTSTVVTCALFVGFGLASVVFWGYFRIRPDPPASADGPEREGPAALESLVTPTP